jgi:hypothetical protein
VFPSLILFIAGCPSGNRFFVNGHDLEARRNYALPSTRHTVFDSPTVGKLEHEIAGLETLIRPFHDVYEAQTGPGQRMLFMKDRRFACGRRWIRTLGSAFGTRRLGAASFHLRHPSASPSKNPITLFTTGTRVRSMLPPRGSGELRNLP